MAKNLIRPDVFTRRESEQLDLRYVNIEDERDNELLCKMFERDRMNGEEEMTSSGMHEIWDLNNLYYESDQLPLGASSDYMQEFVNSQAFTHSGRYDTKRFRLKQNDKNVIYVIDNKIGDIIDRKDAEFADANREIIVKNDDIDRNNQLEKGLQRFLSKLQKQNQVWSQYHYPAIQMKHKLGLAWTSVDYDKSIGNGKIAWKLFHPRDVLLDILPEQKYFTDARHIIPKVRLPLAEAKEFLYYVCGIEPDNVQSDEEYFYNNEPMKARYRTNIGGTFLDEYVTLYFPEYRRIYFEHSNDPGMDVTDPNATYNPKGNKLIYYFNGIWNKSLGCVHWSMSKYFDPTMLEEWQFRFYPWYEKMSNVRLYPLSLVEKFLNIQDIINISETIILDSARQKNRLRAVMVGQLRQKYGAAVDDWFNYGGILDQFTQEDIGEGKSIKDIINFVEFPGLSKEHYLFFDKIQASLKENTQTKEVLEGRLPGARGEYLSGESIKELTARNLVRLQPDQINVDWPVTQEVRRIYRIAALEMHGQDFVEIDDKANNKTRQSPINTSMTMAEFQQYLLKQYPDMDMETAIDEFEKENYVEVVTLGTDLDTGRELNDQEIEQAASEVRINYLFRTIDGKKHNFDIRAEFDFGFKQREQEDKQILSTLYTESKAPAILKRLLRKMSPDISNQADDIVAEVIEHNQVLQVGTEILNRGPEFQQMVGELANRFDAAVSAAKQGAKPNNKPKVPVAA